MGLDAGTALSLVSALALAALSSLLLLRRRWASDLLLAALCLVLALMEVLERFWAGSAAGAGRAMAATLFLMSLLPFLALAYSLRFARERTAARSWRSWLVIGSAAVLAPATTVLLPRELLYQWEAFAETGLVALGPAGYWLHLGIMVSCIAALVNLEATFAGSSGAERWRIKYEFFGAVALLGMLVVYLSQGLLFRSVNTNLIPVRSGVFLLGAACIGFSRLARGGGARIVVSRFIAYRSFTLLVVGVYLVFLGALGGGVRLLELPLGLEAWTFVFLASGLALLVLLFSEQLRRRTKVFVNKHFYAQKYDYRQEWLRFSEDLARCRGAREVGEVIVRTYSRIFGIEGTALYLQDRQGTRLALAVLEREGQLPREMPVSEGLRRYLLERGRVLNTRDAEYRATPEEARFLAESGAWLAVPIPSPAHLEGVVLLRQRLVREDLNYEDFDMMRTLARQAGLSLMSYRLAGELAEAGELAAIAKVSSFVVHDLKNVAYTFSLMLDNAAMHIGDRDFQQDLLASIRGSVDRMNGLIMKLKGLPRPVVPRADAVDLRVVLEEAVRQCGGLKEGVSLVCEAREATTRGDAAELGKVALNLILNAADAVGERGEIRACTGVRDAGAFLRVEDTGVGMSEYFVSNHLFRPFRTTKDAGLGIGLYQCSQIVAAHGGRIDVASAVGKGSTFTVYLPAESP